MNKQIEGMANVICESCGIDHCAFTRRDKLCPQVLKDAKALYDMNYRKQTDGEWLKYPHNSGIYCSLCKHKRRYRDINDAFCPNCGAKMKGGDNE